MPCAASLSLAAGDVRALVLLVALEILVLMLQTGHLQVGGSDFKLQPLEAFNAKAERWHNPHGR